MQIDLLAGRVAHRDVLRPVEDGVEGLVRLHAEGGDGDEDEEQGAECHVLEERKKEKASGKSQLQIKKYSELKRTQKGVKGNLKTTGEKCNRSLSSIR